MTTFTNAVGQMYGIVEVPKNFRGLPFTNTVGANKFLTYGVPSGEKGMFTSQVDVILPQARTYTIHCTYSQMTEEQAGEVVDKVTYDLWINYTAPRFLDYQFGTAADSFNSLLRSLHLDTSKEYVILKIEKA